MYNPDVPTCFNPTTKEAIPIHIGKQVSLDPVLFSPKTWDTPQWLIDLGYQPNFNSDEESRWLLSLQCSNWKEFSEKYVQQIYNEAKKTLADDPHAIKDTFGLNNILLRNGRNLRATIETDGKLECISHDQDSGATIRSNPLFDPSQMRIEPSKYIFSTQYPRLRDNFSHLSVGDLNDQKRGNTLALEQFLDCKVPPNMDFITAIRKITDKVSAAFDGVSLNRDDQYQDSADVLLQEFKQRGLIKGDCTHVTRLVRKLLNDLGLTTRSISGQNFNFHDRTEHVCHVWPEVSVPRNDGTRFWIPVDPWGSLISWREDFDQCLIRAYFPKITNATYVNLTLQWDKS